MKTGPDQTEAVLYLVYSGWSLKQVGELFGVSKQRIGQITRASGADFRWRSLRSPFDATAMRRDRIAGMTLSAIAQKHHCHFNTAWKWTRDIPRPPLKKNTHGTRPSYIRRGCRCEACRAANAATQRALQSKRRQHNLEGT